MNIRLFAIVGAFALLLIVSLVLVHPLLSNVMDETKLDVYVGIDVAYDDIESITALVNEVSSYTNLFIVGCMAITQNETRLNNICQDLYDKGLSFIVYQNAPISYYTRSSGWLANQTRPSNTSILPYPHASSNWTTPHAPNNFTLPYDTSKVSNWTETAKNRWGTNFLGLYYLDEPAGRQLDLDPEWTIVRNATDYTDASNKFNLTVGNTVNWYKSGYSNWTDISLFTSDYALYHFDYEAGYDVLLAQLGWNYSRQLNIALCRGAATVQNKDWGAIITWEYTTPPYIESGNELYNDMVLAYENGAKYIAVFDSNEEYTQSTLTEEHLNALKQFWQYIKQNPRSSSSVNDRVGFVLPKDYAYGFRGPNDKIWGLWAADAVSLDLCASVNSKLEQYGDKLDIIYDGESQLETCGYKLLFYWNT
jgi:hypothetical protein